jgi:hypothetical protein
VAIVVDAGVVRGAGGVEGVAWGAVEVMGIAQGAAEVCEAGDEGATHVLAVGLPSYVPGVVGLPGLAV